MPAPLQSHSAGAEDEVFLVWEPAGASAAC